MSLTIVGTVRRTNDILYGTSALVSGLDVGETLTRDDDIWDSAGTVAFANEKDWKTLYSSIAGCTGKCYTLVYDGTYYQYQEWNYNYTTEIATEITANRLGSSSGKLVTVTVNGSDDGLLVRPNPNNLFTGTVKFRVEETKP